MDDRTLELRPCLWADLDRSQYAGDELAVCLERFLEARADERTLQRAREALALWERLTTRPLVSPAGPGGVAAA